MSCASCQFYLDKRLWNFKPLFAPYQSLYVKHWDLFWTLPSFPSLGLHCVLYDFFFAVGVKILYVFSAVSLSLHSFLILVGRRLQRPSCVCTGTTVAFSSAMHWIALQPVPHAKKKKKMQPVEVMWEQAVI